MKKPKPTSKASAKPTNNQIINRDGGDDAVPKAGFCLRFALHEKCHHLLFGVEVAWRSSIVWVISRIISSHSGDPSSSSRSPLSSRRVMATGVLPLYFTVQLRHIRSPSAHVLSGNSCLSKASTYRLACNNEPPPKRCAVATASSFRPCFRRFSTCSFKIVCFTINIFF